MTSCIDTKVGIIPNSIINYMSRKVININEVCFRLF